jgi:flagellar basal-body rod protein FlgC
MDLNKAMEISASGMYAQGQRVKVIAENIANADSTSEKPGGAPYQRKVITFKSLLDRSQGIEKVAVQRISNDSKTPFGKKYEPGSPAADGEGYVQTANVNPVIEMMDMREAQRSYEANLNLITMSKTMISRAIDLLR